MSFSKRGGLEGDCGLIFQWEKSGQVGKYNGN